MKSLIFASLALMSLNAFAIDPAVKHASLCESDEVKAIQGENGSCRVVITPSTAEETSGACVGIFKGALPCSVVFITMAEGSAMQLVCGDPKSPAIDQMMGARAAGYSVSAIVTKADGTDVVIEDPASYSVYESGLVSLALSKNEGNTAGEISINLRSGIVDLTNVVCR